MTIFAALLLAATTATAVSATDPACVAPAPLAEPWTSWPQNGQMKAGAQAHGAPALILGKPVTATLIPSAYVQFPTLPAKGAKEGHGGLFTLALKQTARIGVALDSPAWIDIVTGQGAQTSVDHEHGPACSGIRKIVWFDLAAGRHIVQIAGAKTSTVRIMAADAHANQ